MSFRITREWIKAVGHPENGAWNAKQLEVVGIAWPPVSGWITSLCARTRTITKKQKSDIEQFRMESLEREAHQVVLDAARREDVYYTWPDGKGSWTGSKIKPEWWDREGR